MIDEETIEALKRCLTGGMSKEITSEYVLDERKNAMVMTKQRVCEKTIPPNPDLMKLVFLKLNGDSVSIGACGNNGEVDYNALSDEELEREKLRLLKELAESQQDIV